MTRLPENGIWKSSGQSDTLGSLWDSFQLDLTSKPGKTLVHPRSIITTNDIADLDTTVAFQTFTDQNAAIQYVWAVSGKYIWRRNIATGYQGAFAKDASTGTPSGADNNTSCSSDESDLVIYNKTYMFATTRTDIYRYDASAGTWGDSAANPLTAGTPHMLEVYEGRIYVTDEYTKIKSFTTSTYDSITSSGTNTINLATNGNPVTSISFIKRHSKGIWVGTVNQSESGCYVYDWDGIESTMSPQKIYLIPDAGGVWACVVKDDKPWILDSNGRLMFLTASTFIEAPNGRLPIKNVKLLKNALSSVNNRPVHPNGMRVVNGRIRVLINNEYGYNGATIEENFHSGIYEYDPQVGWYHIVSPSLYSASVTDFGQTRISRAGALYAAKTDATDASANGTMIFGAQVYTDSSTTAENIYIEDTNDTVQKFGYLVTTKIYSSNINEIWSAITPRIRRLQNSNDRVWLWYRTTDEEPTEATITWTSTTTFTTTTNVSAYYDATDTGDKKQYQVEIIQGKGSGKFSRITSISEAGGTYTVTVEDAFTGATSGTAKARFQYWKYIGVVDSQKVDYKTFKFKAESPWIQFKIGILATGKDELNDIIIGHSQGIPVKP